MISRIYTVLNKSFLSDQGLEENIPFQFSPVHYSYVLYEITVK